LNWIADHCVLTDQLECGGSRATGMAKKMPTCALALPRADAFVFSKHETMFFIANRSAL
jgi:hypothetical protein